MPALTRVQEQSGAAQSAQRVVLPRLLRRPVRQFQRLIDGEFTPPRFAATMMSAALLALTGFYGAALGGHGPAVLKAATTHTGFAVSQITVAGNVHTSEIDVIGALGLDGWTSMVGFDAGSARQRVSSLPWVERADIRKIYPETLEVRLTERQPFALWQQGEAVSVVERDGSVIAPFTGGSLARLPLVIGAGAAERAASFIAGVAGHGPFAGTVRGYVRVGDRRWDLVLDNNVVVRLPETGALEAIARLIRIDGETGLLARDIVAVDLRFEDRLLVQLSQDAAATRAADIEARTKALKKRNARKGRRI